jgi:hypothetical protein
MLFATAVSAALRFSASTSFEVFNPKNPMFIIVI